MEKKYLLICGGKAEVCFGGVCVCVGGDAASCRL
jgi:hypothetical protein